MSLDYKYGFNLAQYKRIAKYINSNSKHCSDTLCIFEIGSRDAADAFLLSCLLPGHPHIVSIDPHARFLDLSKPFVLAYPNLKVENVALSKKSGLVDFYSTDTSDLKNHCDDHGIGASSIKEPILNLPGMPTTGFNKSQVRSMTGIDFCQQHGAYPHVLILDTQGSELEVLDSFGEALNNAHLIFTEFHLKSSTVYRNDASIFDMVRYLKTKNFLLVNCYGIRRYYGDAVFVNVEIFSQYYSRLKLLALKLMSFYSILKLYISPILYKSFRILFPYKNKKKLA